jgi:hypothetical protein
MTTSDREKIEAYAWVVSAARRVLDTGMGIEWEGTGTPEEAAISSLRRAVAAFDKAHGAGLRSARKGD